MIGWSGTNNTVPCSDYSSFIPTILHLVTVSESECETLPLIVLHNMFWFMIRNGWIRGLKPIS